MADQNDDLIRQTRETAVVVEDALRNIASKIKDVFEDALTTASSTSQTFSKTLIKDISSGLNSLAKVSQQLESNQAKLNAGSLKRADIEKQILERTAKIKSLEDQIEIARVSGVAVSQEILDALAEQESYNTQYIDHLHEQAKQADIINKKIGLTGGLLKGFSKIPILGGLIESEKVLARIQKEAGKSTSTKFSVFKEGAKGVGSSIMENLTSPFALATAGITLLVKAIKFVVDAMFGASKLTAQFKRDFIVSSEEAEKVRQRTYDIAFNSKNLADTEGKILITQTQIVKSLEQANQALGVQMDLTSTLGEYGQQLLVQTSILRDNFGLSEEAIAGVTQESIRTGKTTEQITKNLTGGVAAIFLEKKLGADFNKILEQAYKTSGVLRLSFKGSSDEIAKGIAKLQLMGLTLQDTQKVAAGLLDFESSISAQIAAELLTGKQIYLERARLYALNRDFVGVGKELINQGITYNYLQTLNSEALEAQAKVFNLTGDELSDIIKKQEESNALSERAAKFGVKIKDINKQSLLDLYEANKNLLTSQEDLAKILGEEIYNKKLSEDAQTQFNKQLEKAKEIFASFVSSGALDKLANKMTQIVNALESGQSLGSILLTGARTEKDIAEMKKERFEGGTTWKDLFVNDFTIRTHPKDTLVMAGGTKLGNNDETLKAQQETNMLLKQLLSKSTDITLNGEKLTNGLAKQTYALGS